jgi:hypothetical protein
MRRRPACPALLALVLLVVGQLAALAHHAETRHVECTDHGEELEAAKLAQALDDCEQQHWIAVEGDGGGDHDDCAIARALHQSARVASGFIAPAITSIVTQHAALSPADVAIARELILFAPKTSPPV